MSDDPVLVWIVREKHPDHFCEAYIIRNEIPQRGYYGPKKAHFFWRVRNISNKTRLPRGIVQALRLQPGECRLLVDPVAVDFDLGE